MSKFKKCDATGMCPTMLDRIELHGKGLRPIHTVNLNEKVNGATSRLLGVAYHRNAKDRGLLLNICPWCLGKPGYYLNGQLTDEAREKEQ